MPAASPFLRSVPSGARAAAVASAPASASASAGAIVEKCPDCGGTCAARHERMAKRQPDASVVSFLFDASEFTAERARSWLAERGYAASMRVDRLIRVAQVQDPATFRPTSFRLSPEGGGVWSTRATLRDHSEASP